MKTTILPTLGPQTKAPSKCPITISKLYLKKLMVSLFLGNKRDEPILASGRCPLGFDQPEKTQDSVFIEKASHESAASVQIQGDPEADFILQQARASIYHWPSDFPGFSSRLEVINGEHSYSGSLRAASSRDYTISLPEFEPKYWLRFQIEEFLAHREHPDVSRMASRSGVAMGDNDPIFGRRIDFLGDKMGSYYRIKDKKLCLIGRSYANQDFVITINAHLDCGGTFASTHYTAYYRERDGGNLVRSESFFDEYVLVDGHFLPKERRYIEVNNHGFISRAIRFSEHSILPPS